MSWPVLPQGFLGGRGATTAYSDNDTYQIGKSLRFNSADSAYLSRTPSSAGDRKKFTISMWVKRGKIGSEANPIFAWPGGNTLSFGINFNTSNQLEVIANIVDMSPSTLIGDLSLSATIEATVNEIIAGMQKLFNTKQLRNNFVVTPKIFRINLLQQHKSCAVSHITPFEVKP
jgi:hypothetical protein